MLVTVTAFMSRTTLNAMKHRPPAIATRNRVMLLAPGRRVMGVASRDRLEGGACSAVAGSAIRCHPCGRRDSGDAGASKVEGEQQHNYINTKGMAGGGRAQSRIKWRPYNPNNHIFRTIVGEASREAGQLKPFYT